MNKEKLDLLIEEKINDIFYEYQESHDIHNGDMPPELVIELLMVQQRLAYIVYMQVELNREEDDEGDDVECEEEFVLEIHVGNIVKTVGDGKKHVVTDIMTKEGNICYECLPLDFLGLRKCYTESQLVLITR